ncbi:MAG TPA: discoidin domain-containing protein [Bryobacteraceae bacterium]|nr:discoidin domain-containing protein [Bryobacteraceae bacterium]
MAASHRIGGLLVLILATQWVASAQINSYIVRKSLIYNQTSDSQQPTLNSALGAVELDATKPSDLTAAQVTSTSPLSPMGLSVGGGTLYSFEPAFSSKTTLDTDFPNGTYTFRISGGTLGSVSATVSTPASDAYPPIPFLANNAVASLQGMNPNAPLTLTWNSWTPPAGVTSTSTSFAIFRASDFSLKFDVGSGNLLTSATIPANQLDGRTQYVLQLEFFAAIDRPNAGFATARSEVAYTITTQITFTTGGSAPACPFTLSASSASVGPAASTGSVQVSGPPGCAYTASAPSGGFVTITSGASGSGSGTVTYSVQPNSSPTSRYEFLSIAGLNFDVFQLNGCVLGLTPGSQSFPPGGGTSSFSVGASSGNCGFTASSSDPSFLTINGSNSGSGSSTVSYTVAPNSANFGRTGTITVTGQGAAAGQTQIYTVIEAGNGCKFALAQASQAIGAGGGTGSASVQAPAGCFWTATSSSPFVSITGGASSSGNDTVSYTVQPNSGSAPRTLSLTIAGLPYLVVQSGAATLNCTPSVSAPAQVAIEGRTEILGDLMLACTGLTSTLTADISLTLNTNVTNAISNGSSDAILVNGATTSNGVVAGYNTVFWSGVSLVPNAGNATVHISNVRADASLLGTPASLQSTPVIGVIGVSANVPVPVANPAQILAYAAPTLILQETATTFQGAQALAIQFEEGTTTAFHAAGSVPATRLRVVLSNVPANVSVLAPVFNSDSVPQAQLLTGTDQFGGSGTPVNGQPGQYQPVVASGGVVSATWIVISADPNSLETNTFPLILQGATAQTLSQIQVDASYAPVSTVGVASAISPAAAVPRFRDFSVAQPLVNLRATSSATVTGSATASNNARSSLLAHTAGPTGSVRDQFDNDSPNPAMNAMATETAPGSTITGCQPSPQGSCQISDSGDSAVADLGTIAPGQSVTLVLTVSPNNCISGCTVGHQVNVSAAVPNADLKASESSSNLTFAGCGSGTAVALSPTGGATQSTSVGTPFANPLQATLTDGCGSPVPNQTVTFLAPGSGPSAVLSNVTMTTNASGVASVMATANGVPGSYLVSASVGGLTATFSLTNTPANGGGGGGGSSGKTATQSSTYPGSPPAGVAIDGKTDGNYFDGSVTATNPEANPWWQVDLGTAMTVGTVVIWNRTDCCGSRLSDYWVFVSNTPFLVTDTPSTLASRPGTLASHQTAVPAPSVSIPFGTTARYVRVQLSGSDVLSLAEVQIVSSVTSIVPVASQSSTLPGAPPAGVAMDGNTDGNFFDGSVTATNFETNPWWQVDLGTATTIGSLGIWNRTDCCGSRLSDYWVFVSNTPFLATDTPATLASRAGTFVSHQTTAPNPSVLIPVGTSARYVRVQLSGTDYLSLAEVQVISSTEHGPVVASQSSTFPSAPSAEVAVDGNTDGNFFDGSVTATNLEANPWWQVDLGTATTVGTVVIWNRTDCCGSRLSDYWVFVSNTPFLATDTPATLASRAGTFASHQTAAPNPSTVIQFGVLGRYVRVQLSGSNILSLAEVQVLGTSGPAKVASQSSTLPGAPDARVAIDGNTDGNFFHGSVTATNLEANPWWQVDLGVPIAVNSVTIWNRTDCCGSRLSDYWVFVSDTPFLATDTTATLASRAGTFASHQTSAPAPSVTIPFGVQGRYVRVQLSGTDYLSLAEVQVSGQ